MNLSFEVEAGFCQCGCGNKTPLYKKSNKNIGKIKGAAARFCKGHMKRDMNRYSVSESGCWEWSGMKDREGYAIMLFTNRQKRLHRIFYEKVKGPIPIGLVIDHLCRNKSCVNPDHLEAVHTVENTRRGLRAKLTTKDVAIIKRSLINGATQKSLATKYGVDPATIYSLLAGKSWKDIAPAATEVT